MARTISFLLAVVLTGLLSFIGYAASPSVNMPQPRGLQRGTDAVLTLSGSNLADVQESLFLDSGITVTRLEVVNSNQIKLNLKLAPDCPLGEHSFRVRTLTGISNMSTFWVGALPIVEEKEPNSEFGTPQKIPLNVTVHGVIQNEDVDYFAIDAKKGQRVSVEIEGMRLATTFFDPHISILDGKRFELASSDDTPLFKQDGCLSIIAANDGPLIVQVRETSYGGNGSCQYRLHVGTFPRPTAILPAGGKAGDEIEVTFLGDASGPIKSKIKVPVAAAAPEKFGLFCQDAGGISPSPIPFRISKDAANVIDLEPNDSIPQATKGVLPCSFNGIIDKPGDIDFFRFSARKGQVYDVECFARRIGSPLDPVLVLYNAAGNAMASNDDSRGPDSYFRVSIPADGEYLLSVTDHLKQGGPTHTYRIEIHSVQPQLNLSIPKVAQYSQLRQSFAIPRGNRMATMISASRIDMGGELIIKPVGLPQKVTSTSEPMAANMTVVPVVMEAAADAPIAGSLGHFTATPGDSTIKTESKFSLFTEFILGQPGQSVYWSTTIPQTAFVVTKEVPFSISIIEPKVPLVQNGSMQLKIVAHRKDGFTAPITVSPLYNPPGIGSATTVTIAEGQNEVLLPINANGGAPIRKWAYVVAGTATVDNAPVWVSSQLATLEVAAPFLGLTFQRGAVEQGKDTQIYVKIDTKKPFAGSAAVKLIGLPAKVTSADQAITKDSKEISFPIKTDPKAPAGIHRNLFCQVIITENGEPITHNLGATELRIDIPIPPKKDQPVVARPMPQPMPQPSNMPPKRLSRLEQLRLEQEEREKAARQGSVPSPKTDGKK